MATGTLRLCTMLSIASWLLIEPLAAPSEDVCRAVRRVRHVIESGVAPKSTSTKTRSCAANTIARALIDLAPLVRLLAFACVCPATFGLAPLGLANDDVVDTQFSASSSHAPVVAESAVKVDFGPAQGRLFGATGWRCAQTADMADSFWQFDAL